jgi:hypothetical protein
MVDLGITISIQGNVTTLARMANFLRDLRDQGVDFSVTLSQGDWQQTYATSQEWHDAIRSPTLGPFDEVP